MVRRRSTVTSLVVLLLAVTPPSAAAAAQAAHTRGDSNPRPLPSQPSTLPKEKDLDRIEHPLYTSLTRFTGRDQR